MLLRKTEAWAKCPAKQGITNMKTAEQFITFGQGNVEALVKSGQIVATGLQDLTKQIAANAQAAVDESVSTFRALSTVRSVKEAFDLQANFARTQFEKAVAQSGQLTETSFKLAEEALAPLAGRMTLAVESFKAA
jgi:phasin family protein